MNRRDALHTLAGAAALAPVSRLFARPLESADALHQPPPAMNPSHLAHCQLGFRPGSPKTLTLLVDAAASAALPERIPFYLRGLFQRMPRRHSPPVGWSGKYFRWPFDLEHGELMPANARIAFQGDLIRTPSRWGTVWQGDFTAFAQEGHWQIETNYGSTYPVTIQPSLYDRIQRGFINYLHCQRSGFDLPGIRRADHLDDGRLDTTGEQISAAGGWYDAGDLRKWLFLTQPNLAALATLATRGHPGLRAAALDEIRWGNKFFHGMISGEGQVWGDVGGGTFKAGLDLEKDWWYENHPGCNCDNSGAVFTDNLPGTGDERPIRTDYNPAVQFMFVRTQGQVAPLLAPDETEHCRGLALRAWLYGRRRGHDRRTLFVAEELLAAIELKVSDLGDVTREDLAALANELLSRQETGEGGLSGYFLEKGGDDAFRCIAFSCEPVVALLRLVESAPKGLEEICERARIAISRYLDWYVLADATSNPFGVGPYGVYFHPPSPELQSFRDAGRGRGVRTFIHPFSAQQIVHGTSSVVMHQAAVCAKAGHLLNRPDWKSAAERLLQWTLGHNPEGLCLHSGVGFKHPTPFSAAVTQLPDTVVVGHIGRPDDTPYQEASPLIEWSSQEIWDIPHGHMTEAVLWL